MEFDAKKEWVKKIVPNGDNIAPMNAISKI